MRELTEGDYVDFTLKYSGPLFSGAATSAKLSKTTLRESFHEQLAVLWSVHPYLKKLDPGEFARQPARSSRYGEVAPDVLYERDMLYRCLVGGIDYVPLVNYGHRMHCHLSIRLHTRRGRGGIIHQGPDIDNRLKVLLDALTIPMAPNTAIQDTDNEEPLRFCLLEDDDLVTKFSVETFRLLKPDDADAPNEAEVDIDVHVAPISPIPPNFSLLFP
jgi:hypothetical protein